MKTIICYINKIGSLNTMSVYYFNYKINKKLGKKIKKKKKMLVNFSSSFYKEGMKIVICFKKKKTAKKSWEVIKILK